MEDRFFTQPILNSPYEYPSRHWVLDDEGQPTKRIIDRRCGAESITPIPKPSKRKRCDQQMEMVLDEGKGLSTAELQYDPTGNINLIQSLSLLSSFEFSGSFT
jgi:type III restriction enzyme